LVGAVNFAFSNYRIQPQDPASDSFVSQNARPAEEPTTYGDLVVASANVLNSWTTLGGRGAFTPEQLEVQTEKLVAELRGTGTDIIGLQEIENDPAHEPIHRSPRSPSGLGPRPGDRKPEAQVMILPPR
jgi:predicted extracellular nuclease